MLYAPLARHIVGRFLMAAAATALGLLAVTFSVELAGQLRSVVGQGGRPLPFILTKLVAGVGAVSLPAVCVGAAAAFGSAERAGEWIGWGAAGGRIRPFGWLCATAAGIIGACLMAAGIGPLPPVDSGDSPFVLKLDNGILYASQMDTSTYTLLGPEWVGLDNQGQFSGRWSASRALWTDTGWIAQKGRHILANQEYDRGFLRMPVTLPAPALILPPAGFGWPNRADMERLESIGWSTKRWRSARALAWALPLLLGGLTLLGAWFGSKLSGTLLQGSCAAAAGVTALVGCTVVASLTLNPEWSALSLGGTMLALGIVMWLRADRLLAIKE